ncbi:MAG: SUMF1/EgtB/PvdO family nonheme iron enzyme [Planctomycetes bacterium]|nr:SUMF1/EgtB/PvdO family nonheme iron enzyme [Planctomycetota bacterium]
MSTPISDPSRLARAIRLSLEFRSSQRTDIEAFLVEHSELRDLMEPMISADANPEIERTEAAAPRRGEHFRVGIEIGGYRLERRLGEGGMGSVFLAVQKSLDRPVALKILTAPSLLLSERALWRFQREARLLANLDHPNIVKVIETGDHEGRPFFAMELVDGASLAAVLAAVRRAGLDGASAEVYRAALRGSLPEGSRSAVPAEAATSYVAIIVEIVAQIADALACAHAAGVVHRDVKPSNILLRSDGRALLADFGVAHREGAAALTVTGDRAGTPTHMSPEQARGDELDHRSDLFSLGVVLYEGLTLELPFPGETAEQVLASLLSREPVAPNQVNPAVSRDLAAVVLKALEKAPARRYPSASAFARDLRAALTGQAVSARWPGPFERGLRRIRREPWKAAALALVCVALLVAFALDRAHASRLREESARTAAALADVQRLAIGVRLDRAEAAALAFRRSDSDDDRALSRWLREEGEPLERELPRLVEMLAQLRRDALPYGEAEATRDREEHPEHFNLQRLEQELQFRLARLERGSPLPEADAARRDLLLEAEGALREKVQQRRTWMFATEEQQFLHDQVATLIARLELFIASPRSPLQYVRHQIEQNQILRQRIFEDAAALWRSAAESIAADPRFAGFVLKPQRGLVPLGPDPRSGLWEFVHLRSGEPDRESPSRRADGFLEPSDEMGIVFVLLPGGPFSMGAQADDPAAPNYDADSREHERPVRTVELEPFFLSKYEMTQGQWKRLSGGHTPSFQSAAKTAVNKRPATWRHPVESLSQRFASTALEEHALRLPTEAQWEYACRAGTTTPWPFERKDAARYANVSDRSAKAVGANWRTEADLDDGHAGSAPVGSYLPNAFGLHDLCGNVAELVDDATARYDRPALPGDGRHLANFGEQRCTYRGGSFAHLLKLARSCDRDLTESREFVSQTLGLRAARRVQR